MNKGTERMPLPMRNPGKEFKSHSKTKQPTKTLRSFEGYSTLLAMQAHTRLLLTGKAENENVSS